MWLLRKILNIFGTGARAFVALVGVASITVAVADYTATQGAGTNFGSVIQTSVHYAKQIVCDFTAPATICATVKAANTVATTDVGLVVAVANTLPAGQAAMAASSPIVIASNQTANALWGQGATGSAVPANAQYGGALDAVGGTNLIGVAADPCQSTVKSTLPITLATAAVKVIATGVAAKKIYVCQINLNNNAADTVAIFEATTATTCATAAVAVIGAGTSVATAGTGYNFAATGGISLGTGANQVLVTTVNNNDLCLAQSAATQLSGSITYVTR